MKNLNAIAGPLLALGFWLLDAQPGQCFYNQGGCARASTPAPDGAAIGTPPVQHEYGPFGEVVRATGPMAKANHFRLSTKYQDDETDLLYYGYRYYSASTGRWLSRDPIEEQGGLLLYGFVANNPVNYVDPTGQIPLDTIWDIANIIYDIAVGDYVSLTADVAALAVPYVPAGSTKLVKAAKATDVVSMDSKAIKTLKVEFQYYGNAQGFTKHTLPASAANWVARTKGQASKFMPGWGDAEIKTLIQEALDEAKKKGLLKPGQLNGYVYDARKTVGASDGCLVKRIEIKINNDGKNLHAYPVK